MRAGHDHRGRGERATSRTRRCSSRILGDAAKIDETRRGPEARRRVPAHPARAAHEAAHGPAARISTTTPRSSAACGSRSLIDEAVGAPPRRRRPRSDARAAARARRPRSTACCCSTSRPASRRRPRCTRAKRLFDAAKAGHTGTLDPMATGLLPIALRRSDQVLARPARCAPRRYRATVRLGVDDHDRRSRRRSRRLTRAGRRRSRSASRRSWRSSGARSCRRRRCISALKHAGKPLYEYARAGHGGRRARRGRSHRRSARRWRHCSGDELGIGGRCSKGTYIRVLAEDIGSALGCGAHLAALAAHRASGAFASARRSARRARAPMSRGAARARLLRRSTRCSPGLPALELDRGRRRPHHCRARRSTARERRQRAARASVRARTARSSGVAKRGEARRASQPASPRSRRQSR